MQGEGLHSRWKRFWHERKHGKNIFLIYSMGKVGSSTVYQMFKAKYPFLPVVQLHFLSDKWIKEIIPAMDPYYHINLKPAEEFKSLRKQFPDHRIKIITLVREPVSRDISDIFENWQDYFKTTKAADLNAEKVMERMHVHDFSYTLNWFDSEFKEWTGIDVYKMPFDRDLGYNILSTLEFDVLVIKLERLDRVLPEALMQFCGLKMINPPRSNDATQKVIKDLYRHVMSGFRLSDKQADVIYNSKLIKHFYNNAEIEEYKSRWWK